jgi:hypothetical protein
VELRKTPAGCLLSKGGRREADPDFQDFALDCIRLSNQEKSPTLRHRLLMLAREWMHAAMHQLGAEINRESTERMDANSGEPWSEMDISDLTNEIAHHGGDR